MCLALRQQLPLLLLLLLLPLCLSPPQHCAACRSVVNPTALREALDSVTQFKQQEMNDANELLDALYECFKKAQGASPNEPGSRGVLIDGVFGLKLNEAVVCKCVRGLLEDAQQQKMLCIA
jgi:hypothetical protein